MILRLYNFDFSANTTVVVNNSKYFNENWFLKCVILNFAKWDHMAKRRVKLLVSKVIVDSSHSFYSPHLPTVRLPTSYLPLCLFDKPPRNFLYPPTHSTMRLLVRNRGGPLGVSHWLPHRPFVLESWWPFCFFGCLLFLPPSLFLTSIICSYVIMPQSTSSILSLLPHNGRSARDEKVWKRDRVIVSQLLSLLFTTFSLI